MLSKVLFMFGAVSEVADASSLGYEYVLQVKFNETYQALPLTVDDAQAVGWQVSEDCVPGLGRRAQAETYLNLWHAEHGAMHLWFDRTGSVMGFGATAASPDGAAAPWTRVGDDWEINFLTRDPESACGDGPPAEEGSIGDRLLMVGPDGVTAIPTTLQGAFDENYNDGGPCFPYMGWHMMYNRYEPSSPAPVYSGRDGSLLAMNLNTFATQVTPSSYDYPAPKEGKAIYGWHVYFKEFHDACAGTEDGGENTADWFQTQFDVSKEDEALEYTDFHCTPYFGQLWVQTIATVVDLHATGSVCQNGDVDCKFVHYVGPNVHLGFATPCVPPAPTDGCHCYHQVTYTSRCEHPILSSNASGTVDTSDAFDEHGVLRECSEDVVTNAVVGWAPPAENPTQCDCEGPATVQV